MLGYSALSTRPISGQAGLTKTVIFDCLTPIDYLLNQAVNFSLPQENSALLRADLSVLMDFQQRIFKDAPTYPDILSGLFGPAAIPQDDLAQPFADRAVPLEYEGSSFRVDAMLWLEYQERLSRDAATAPDDLSGVFGPAPVPQDDLSQPVRDTSIFEDTSLGARGDIAFPLEYGGSLLTAVIVPVAISNAFIRDMVIPNETGMIVTADRIIQADISVLQHGDLSGPLEASQGVKGDAIVPAAPSGTMQGSTAVPVDFGGPMFRDISVPANWSQNFNSDSIIPQNASKNLTSDSKFFIDYEIRVTVDLAQDVQVEYGGPFVADFVGPIEWWTLNYIENPDRTLGRGAIRALGRGAVRSL